MQIGERLLQVASLVPACHTAADIGTDHGYVPAYLLLHDRCTTVIASDIAAGPCRAARETCARYGLENRMQVRQAAGLEGLEPGEAQSIVIAGMGGAAICMILEASPAISASVKTLILQPMNGDAALRHWIAEHGYVITEERICREHGRLYVILAVRHAEEPRHLTLLEEEIGPCILHSRPTLWREYAGAKLTRFRRLLTQMEQSPKAQASAKFRYVKNMSAELGNLLNR